MNDLSDFVEGQLTVEGVPLPSEIEGGSIRHTAVERGLIRFDTFSTAQDGGSGPLRLEWETFEQLRFMSGQWMVTNRLRNTDLLDFGQASDASFNKLRREVLNALSQSSASALAIRLDATAEHCRHALVAALWAQIYEEPYSPVWLAAMAQHAASEGDMLAFGHLVAQLQIQHDAERDFVRGRDVRQSASKGGQTRALNISSGVQSRLAAMDKLIEGGKSVRDASRRVFEAGLGKSSAANAKLWHRRKQC